MLTPGSRRVREARKLTRRIVREKAGLFLAEGAQAVREAVAAGRDCTVEIFATDVAGKRHSQIVAHASAAGISILTADDAALASLSETVTPQGLVAVCRSLTVNMDEALGDSPRLVVVVVEARDPGNVGTVIRSADAAGADAVVIIHGSADPQGGKSVRASAGSLFHLPIVVDAGIPETITELRGRGVTVLAADGSGQVDLNEADDAGLLARPTAWLFGNEAWGLPEDARALADHIVRVPIYGRAESLNLASAAAVCLFASARGQRPAGRA